MTGNGTERARILLADALEMDAADISAKTAIGAEERWDSLAHLRIIEAIEDAMGKPLDAEAIVSISSLNDIASILDHAGN
jgi:acyl carrier protein